MPPPTGSIKKSARCNKIQGEPSNDQHHDVRGRVRRTPLGERSSGFRRVGTDFGRMERLPLSLWHLKVRAIIGTATFFDGIYFLAIALALPVLAGAWHLTPVQIGLLISGSAFGQLIGAVGFGYMAERYGRIPSIATTVLIFGLTGIGCALSWDFYSMFFFRCIQGIGMGAEVPVAASYINEIAPAQKRGRFVLLYEFVFAVGVLSRPPWPLDHSGLRLAIDLLDWRDTRVVDRAVHHAVAGVATVADRARPHRRSR